MARHPRSLTVFANHAVHKVWRGHNKEWNLGTDDDKVQYLEFLNQDLESKIYEAGSQIEALTLMSNHAHELSRVHSQPLFSNHMRRHHGRYGMHFNKRHQRSGKVAEDRPHTTLIQGQEAEMETVFYIHANPIRANLVKDARNYRWSTHRLYAYGLREAWMRNIRFPNWYLRLGRNFRQRQRQYRRLFARYLQMRGRYKSDFLRRHFFGQLTWIQDCEKRLIAWRKARVAPA